MAVVKAQQWAKKTPEERVKLYRSMAQHCRDVARALGPGEESRRLELTARNWIGVAATVRGRIEIDRHPQCCASARLFGSCDCGVSA